MDKEQIKKLGELARITIREEEEQLLEGKLQDVLSYVSRIQEVVGDTKDTAETRLSEHRNVMREDSAPHEAGAYTKQLLHEAPFREGQYVKVKNVL